MDGGYGWLAQPCSQHCLASQQRHPSASAGICRCHEQSPLAVRHRATYTDLRQSGGCIASLLILFKETIMSQIDLASQKQKEVRLFPSHHIGSEREAELRAAASFLATARAVSEFGRRVVAIAGGPKGSVRCYAEVPFRDPAGTELREDRVDGILHSSWGKKDWRAIVEVKVGNCPLEQGQFDRYHALASEQRIDAFITISNQPATADGFPPDVKPRFKKVPVVHLSWERLLSEARQLSLQKEVADPDQQWILEEWIRYLMDDNSHIIEQPQMGKNWGKVLRCVRENNLGACRNEVADVVEHWDAFLKKLALRLRAKLGVNTVLKLSKAKAKKSPPYSKDLLETALHDGQLTGTFHIPDAAGNLSVAVLLAPRCVQYSIDIKAPTEGKPKTQVRWLLKQLRFADMPEGLVVQVNWGHQQLSQATIEELKNQPDCLLARVPKDAIPRSFCLQLTRKLLKCKGRSSAPVLTGIEKGLDEFYHLVVEGIKRFVPKAPKIKNGHEGAGESVPSVQESGVPADQSAISHGSVECDQSSSMVSNEKEDQSVA